MKIFEAHSLTLGHLTSSVSHSSDQIPGSVSVSDSSKRIRDEKCSGSRSCVTFESEGRGNGGWECTNEDSSSSEIRGILPSCFLQVREDGEWEGERTEKEGEREKRGGEVMVSLELFLI